MPDLIYNVKFQIDEASLEQVSQASSRATGGASGGGQTFYEQNINNSKRYQAVIKQELNLIVNQTQARQRSANSLDQVDKATRDFIKTIQDETAAVRAATAQTRLQENVSNQTLISLGERSNALKNLINDERLLAIAQDKAHPLYRTANQLISAGAGAAKSAAMEMGKYGTQILEIARSSNGLVSVESALTQAVKAKTDEVRRYNAIVEVRGALTSEEEIKDYQRATQELQDLRAELLQVANASEDIDSSQIREMNQALRGAGQAATSADRYLSGMAGQMGGVNRLGNNVNQVMLSFGDAIQDSAQFSYGFASGMRAVGNNLTFAAEQFSYAYQRAGSLSGVLAQFRSVMLGPVGVVVGINAAVTAITLLTDWFGKSGNSASTASESASKLTETIRDLTEANLELAESEELVQKGRRTDQDVLKAQIESLETSAKSQESYIKMLEQSNVQTVFGVSRSEALKVARQNLATTNQEIEKTEGELLAQRLRDVATLGLSVDATEADIEARKKGNEATANAIEFMAEYSNSTDLTTEALSEMFTEGNNILAYFRSSGTLTSDQVEIGKQLEQVTYQISDALAVQGRSLSSLMDVTRVRLDQVKTTISSELELFIQAEEQKRKEALKTAKLRAQYEKMYGLDAQKVAQTYSSVWHAHYGITNEDAEDNAQTQRDNASMILRATTQFTSQLMTLRSQNSAQSEQEARKQFETNKRLAYASAVVSGAAAIVDVFRQTKGELVAKTIAAGLAAAAVGVQIAQIKQQQFSYGGGAGMSSGGASKEPSFGFDMNRVEGPQTFRTPAFTPTATNGMIQPKVDVQIMADRKQLYAVVKRGEEEYRNRQA